jgi:uncharacterized membrane protein
MNTDGLAHTLNIGLHVAAGCVALLLGFYLLATPKGTPRHRRLGRWFVASTALVCAAAALGLALFRFLPVFALLTVLVGYQLFSGWRSARTRQQGPQALDLALTLAALGLSLALLPSLGTGSSLALTAGTAGGLFSLLGYELLRWTFPRRWYVRLWRYEHAYKMLAALFGMLSALVGNVVRWGQPWSQLLPSLLGLIVIGVVFWRLSRQA